MEHNKSTRGVFNALMSGLLWGADTSLTGMVLLMLPFTLVDARLASAPLLLAFFHDAFSACMMTGILVKDGQLQSTVKRLNSKSARTVMLAALFGGPLGMRAYLYAVDALGAGPTASLSAVYPVVAAFFGMILLKEKLPWQRLVGLVIAVLAVYGVSQSGDMSTGSNFMLGFIAAILCVLGWSLESVICSIGMKDDITSKQALWIRQTVSSIVYLVFLFTEGDGLYSLLSVVQQPVVWMIALIAIFGTLSYLNYYQAIDTIGPVKATGMNVSYAVWAILFSTLLTGDSFNWMLVLCSILMMVGCVLVAREY